MKRVVGTLVIMGIFICLSSVAAAGQGQARSYSFFINGELGFAVSPEEFTDYYTMGFGAGGGLEYPMAPNWSLIGLFDIKFLSPAKGMIEDWWTEPGEYPNATNIRISEGGVTAGTIALLGKGSLKTEGSTLFPYVKGGFGLTIAGADQIKVEFNNAGGGHQTEWVSGVGTETNISIILGLGLEKTLGNGNSSIFVDAGIHMIVQENVNPTIAPLTIGFKF